MRVKEYIDIINTVGEIKMNFHFIDYGSYSIRITFPEYNYNLGEGTSESEESIKTWNSFRDELVKSSKGSAIITSSIIQFKCGIIEIMNYPKRAGYRENDMVAALNYINSYLKEHKKSLT